MNTGHWHRGDTPHHHSFQSRLALLAFCRLLRPERDSIFTGVHHFNPQVYSLSRNMGRHDPGSEQLPFPGHHTDGFRNDR